MAHGTRRAMVMVAAAAIGGGVLVAPPAEAATTGCSTEFPDLCVTSIDITMAVGHRWTARVGSFSEGSGCRLFDAPFIDWGDGTAELGFAEDGQIFGDHTYESAGTYETRVGVLMDCDPGDGLALASVGATATATVSPTLALTPMSITATTGTQFNGTVARVSSGRPDASADDFEASVNWGDGTFTTPAALVPTAGAYAVNATHTYSQPGTYHVRIDVRHRDGDAAFVLGSASVTVPAAPVPAPTPATPTCRLLRLRLGSGWLCL